MDSIYNSIDKSIDQIEKITKEPAEYGSVFNSMPIEFYIYHPILMRFMFFKWGYYFVRTGEFDNFEEWQLPERLSDLIERYEKAFANLNSTFLIWDESLIPGLVKEIDNFHKMKIINTEDKNAIRDDLKALLVNLEQYIKGTFQPNVSIANARFYVSSVNIGVTSCYCISEKMQSVLFQTNFIYSSINEDSECCIRVRNWIYSLQDISVLLSRSGQVERRLFFNAQHNIIDSILG